MPVLPAEHPDDFRFDAFLSYSRADEAFADRLERSLEKYRPPKGLGVPARTIRVFRDRHDLTGVEYYEAIEEAIRSSRKLVVLCSPAARASQYVGDEIRRFAAARGAQHIIPVLVAGRPNNEVGAEDAGDAAFPEALQELLTMPLATSFVGFDVRRGKFAAAAHADGWYTLLANLFERSRNEVEQREHVRRQKRTIRLGAIAISVIVALSVATTYAFIQRRAAIRQRDAAEAATRIANSRAAAATALQVLPADPLPALHLAIEAADTARTPEAEQALRAVLQRPRVRAVIAHGGRIVSAAFSPDGRRLATGAEDGEARVWDLEAGREVARLTGHRAMVRSIAFGPDGGSILTGSNDGTGRLWNAETGQPLAEMPPQPDPVDASFFPDGRRVLVSCLDGSVIVWDPAAASQPVTLEQPGQTVSNALLAPDGKMVLLTFDNGRVRLRDTLSGALLLEWAAHQGRVIDATFDPAGGRIATTGEDGVARIWDSRSGHLLRELRGHRGSGRGVSVSGVAFSPDGRRLATTSWDDPIALVWDAVTGAVVAHLQGHELDGVSGPSFSPDGRWILTSGGGGKKDGTARLWDARTGVQVAVLHGYGHTVSGARFDPTGRRVTTGSTDIDEGGRLGVIGEVRVWDIDRLGDGAVLRRHTEQATWAAIAPDGITAVSASDDGTARIWNLETCRETAVLRGHQAPIDEAALSPDGHLLATAGRDGTARIWDVASGRQLAVLQHNGPVRSVDFAPDSGRVATASDDSTAVIWAAPGGELLHRLHHEVHVEQVRFSPDGRRLLVGGPGVAYIWDAETGRRLHDLRGHKPHPVAASVVFGEFGPRGTLVTRCSDDGIPRLWDVETGREIAALRGHEHPWIFHASVSPDGETVLTAGQDRTARLWNARTGALRAALQGHTGAVVTAAISPDSRRVATAGHDGTIRIWDSRTGTGVTVLDEGTRIWHVAFAADGSRVVAACEDGTVRVHILDFEPLLGLARARLPVLITEEARKRLGEHVRLGGN